MSTVKDTTIQIRVDAEEKGVLQYRADSLHMSVSEYLIHAGICYIPTESVQAAADALTKTKMELQVLKERHAALEAETK